MYIQYKVIEFYSITRITRLTDNDYYTPHIYCMHSLICFPRQQNYVDIKCPLLTTDFIVIAGTQNYFYVYSNSMDSQYID